MSPACDRCGTAVTCRVAEAAILVVTRDHRGVVTQLCVKCGGAEEPEQLMAPVARKGRAQ